MVSNKKSFECNVCSILFLGIAISRNDVMNIMEDCLPILTEKGEYLGANANTFNHYDAGLPIGKLWVLKCAFMMDIYAGVHYNLSHYRIDSPDNHTLDDFEGCTPRLGFSLGYAF